MRMSRVFGIALLAVVVFTANAAAQSFCASQTTVIAANVPVPVPNGHTQVTLVTPGQAAVVGGLTQAVSGTWTPTPADIAAIAAAEKAAAPTSLNIRWSGSAAAPACEQSFPPVTPIPVPDITPGSGVEAKVWNEGECARAGAEWRQELRRKSGGERFTEIVFLENHNVCYRNRDFGVTGDPIYVGVFTDNAEAWDTATVQFEPCSIEPAEPSILISDKASVLSGFQSGGWQLRTYPERRCFNSSVAVTLKATVGTTDVTARTTLEQATRYRATLHLGTAFTTLHDRSFGLRPDGENSEIYGRGPDDQGPEHYAAVVLYALPRYLPTLVGGHYSGRDVVHENGLLDRIGGVVGVGLKDPTKQFVAGFALEALPGVNLTGTWYFSRVTRLAGVEEGDLFTGAADDIPTRQVWDRDFAWGISLDLRYVSALVTR